MDYDTVTEKDFLEIAKSAADHVHSGKCSGTGQTGKPTVLVNTDMPDHMWIDPVALPEKHKSMEFDVGEDRTLLVLIGKGSG